MGSEIVLVICSTLIIAYIFDLTSKKTKIPSVILLLLLGWLVKQIILILKIELPDFNYLLPIVGTIGLVMIVLEGSLELELHSSKKKMIFKSSILAFLPMIALSFLIASVFSYWGGFSFKNSLICSIPISIISSAIAIPSSNSFSAANREVVIYETSLSDILGVLFFNFVALNEFINLYAVADFFLQVIIMVIISLFSTLIIAWLFPKIDHHIKFIPVILVVVIIYMFSKIFHLPGLIFILLFGLFVGNIDKLKYLNIKWMKVDPDSLLLESHKFRDMVVEISFLIRSLFFLIFGYLLQLNEIFNIQTIFWSLFVIAAIYAIRYISIKLLRFPVNPMFYIAPRGLITILLFLSIMPDQLIPVVNKSLIIQVIILSIIIMSFGLIKIKASTN